MRGINQLSKEIQECNKMPEKFFDELILHRNENTFEVEGLNDILKSIEMVSKTFKSDKRAKLRRSSNLEVLKEVSVDDTRLNSHEIQSPLYAISK